MTLTTIKSIFSGVLLWGLVFMGGDALAEDAPPVNYTIINTYPHDQKAFTQGLVYQDGFFYEGTGLYGHSSLRKVEVTTGRVVQKHTLPSFFFGEGITSYGDKIIQLTWRSKMGFVYERERFEVLQTFTYPTEGWGITHDGHRLIMSDGSSTLYCLDPKTLKEVDRIKVSDNNQPVKGLNELEYIQGEIFANVWPTARIARISPVTGNVLGWIDLSGLLPPIKGTDVLNGIAYDEKKGRIFVTGKLWPKVFEIKLSGIE